jgi:gliding motility-associated-like protein
VTTTDLTSGCLSDTSSITFEIFALPNVPVINITSGSGCSFNPNILQVTNPQAGITYVWSDGQEGISITADQAGPYMVTAVNSNGCSAISNTIIINASLPVDQLPGGCFVACDPLTVCLPPFSGVASYTIYQDGNVFLTGGNNWPASFVITADGSYTIEVTNFNGCTAVSDPLDVMLYTGVGSITVETWLDQDGDGMISGGDVLLPGIPVQIISDDGLQLGATETVPGGQFVFEDYPASNYLAHIDRTLLSSQWKVVIDSITTQIATCDDSVVVSLLLMQNCIVSGPDQFFELCPGELLTLGDSTWSDTGAYIMHMSSQAGCDSVFQVIITAPDTIEINGMVWVDVDHDGTISAADTLAYGITLVLTETSTGVTDIGITDNLGTVTWNTPLTNYTIEIDTSLLAASFLPVIFEGTIDDTLCGTVTIEFLIESACPTVFVIQQNTICPGDSVFIEGQWISTAGQYTFTHSNPVTLCDTVIDVTVVVTPDILIQSVVDWNCLTYGSIDLDLSGVSPFMIAWSNGVTGDSILTGLDAGDYSVLITDDNGCSVEDTFSVIESPVLNFDVPGTYTVHAGDSVLITITGDTQVPGLSYEWTPAGILSCTTCPSSLAFPDQDTVISILITDADSCTYFLEAAINVISDTSFFDQIYVPNVFSPNGDGINDNWRIFSKLQDTYVHQLIIFDRWGSLIYAEQDFVLNSSIGWDGTFKGKLMNPGVFAYTVRLTLGDGRDVVVKGDVTLVR